MTKEERQDLTVVSILGAALGAIGVFGNFAPSLTECQNSGHDPRFVLSLRRAYLASWALALGFGGLVSLADESVMPLVATAGAGAAMTLIYESELPAHHRLQSPLDLFKAYPQLPAASNWGS